MEEKKMVEKTEAVKAPKSKKPETVYAKEELIKYSDQLFSVPSECVVAALKTKDKATVREAEKLINEFLKKEVK